MLAAGLWVRLFLDWVSAQIANLATFGRSIRWRNRLEVCSELLLWHLRGSPESRGLPR